MQTVRHLMAVGVSAAIAFGGSFGNPESSAAQPSPVADPAPTAPSLKAPAPKNSQASSPKLETKSDAKSASATERSNAALTAQAKTQKATTKTPQADQTTAAEPAQTP